MTTYAMTRDAQRLDQLAATQIIGDAEVAHCWELVRHGIQIDWIGTGNLGKLIGHLRAGNGMTLDELTIEGKRCTDPTWRLADPATTMRICANVTPESNAPNWSTW